MHKISTIIWKTFLGVLILVCCIFIGKTVFKSIMVNKSIQLNIKVDKYTEKSYLIVMEWEKNTDASIEDKDKFINSEILFNKDTYEVKLIKRYYAFRTKHEKIININTKFSLQKLQSYLRSINLEKNFVEINRGVIVCKFPVSIDKKSRERLWLIKTRFTTYIE